MDDRPLRVIDLITAAAEHMRERGFENPRLEVERLLGSVLGMSRIELYLAFDRTVDGDDRGRFRALYRRRLAREPLQHLLGETGFREVTVKTDRRALVPRPETEIVVEAALGFLRARPDPLVADLGTGTGVIALSVAYEVPGARVVAVDVSEDALLLAKANARKMGLEHAITLICGDMLDSLAGRGPFDAVLSNPPYVRTGDIDTLEPEVRFHDPRIALDGGPGGTAHLDRIADGVHEHLKPGGLLVLECADNQAEPLRNRLLETNRYGLADIVHDLSGCRRAVKAVLR